MNPTELLRNPSTYRSTYQPNPLTLSCPISFYANNYNNELVQIKKLVLNLFTHSLNAVYGENAVSQRELNSQMMVAELVQLLHVVHQIHANLIHLSEFEAKSLHDGNKLSILSGDFLFAIVMKLLAKIGNSDVTISITDAVNSMNFGQFIIAASEGELLANLNVTKWLELVDLIYASISVKLIASEFGRNFALALQASTELDQLKKFIGLNSQPFGNLNSQAYSQGGFVKSPAYEDIEIVGTALHLVLNLSSTPISFSCRSFWTAIICPAWCERCRTAATSRKH